MQRPSLPLVLLAGLLAAVVASPDLPPQPPESCSTGLLALYINALATDNPITDADRAGESCAVVRSGVDSSLAATGDVISCLCLLDDYFDFQVTALFIEEVPDMIYGPCGGQHAEAARRLAAKCEGIIQPPSPSLSPSVKMDNGAVMAVEAISTNL